MDRYMGEENIGLGGLFQVGHVKLYFYCLALFDVRP